MMHAYPTRALRESGWLIVALGDALLQSETVLDMHTFPFFSLIIRATLVRLKQRPAW